MNNGLRGLALALCLAACDARQPTASDPYDPAKMDLKPLDPAPVKEVRPMPNQNLSDAEIRQDLQYFHWFDGQPAGAVSEGAGGIHTVTLEGTSGAQARSTSGCRACRAPAPRGAPPRAG